MTQRASERQYAEDLQTGVPISLGSYAVTQADLIDFASQWDPQDFHTDPEAAARGTFGEIIGSGVHSLAIAQRLSVLGLYHAWQLIAGRRITDIELTAPVRPGDVLSGTAVVLEVDVDARRDRALVVVEVALTNQDGRAVLSARLDIYVRSRGGQGAERAARSVGAEV